MFSATRLLHFFALALVFPTLGEAGAPPGPRADPLDAFDWPLARSIFAPSSGVGGVLILEDSQKPPIKIVVKFVDRDVNAGVFADRTLETLNLAATGARVYPKKTPYFDRAVRRVKSMVEVLKSSEKKNSAQVKRLEAVLAGADTAQAMLGMRYVPSAHGFESVDDLLHAYDDAELQRILNRKPNALNTDIDSIIKNFDAVYKRRSLGLRLFLNVLDKAETGRFIGRLYVADVLLGNGDRIRANNFTPKGERIRANEINTGNLMLDTNGNLVAIDNFTDVASMRDLAFWKGANALFRTGTPDAAQPQKPVRVANHTVSLTPREWLTMILHGYQRDTVPTPSLDYAIEANRAAKITEVFRDRTKKALEDVRSHNRRLLPVGEDPFKDDKLPATANKFNGDVWQVYLGTDAKERAGKKGWHIHLSKEDVDWRLFQKNVKTGIDEALADLRNDALFKAITDRIPQVYGPGSGTTQDLVKTLTLRRKYLKMSQDLKEGTVRQTLLGELQELDTARVFTFTYRFFRKRNEAMDLAVEEVRD